MMDISLDCQVNIPAVSGLEDNILNVGRHVLLTCHSENSSVSVNTGRLVFKGDEQQTGAVHLIKAEAQGSDYKLELTFYRAGQHNLEQVPLSDGENELILKVPSFDVKSVIEEPQNGKPPQPFGAILPIGLSTPILYFIMLVAVVVLGVLGFAMKWKRAAYYRELKRRLKDHVSPLDPDTQFYRSMRQLEKISYPPSELERAFRLYVLRSYDLPMFDLSDPKVLKYCRYQHPRLKSLRLQLAKILEDFNALKAAVADPSMRESKLKSAEIAALVERMYKFVEVNPGLEGRET